jgi:hypothetical protein
MPGIIGSTGADRSGGLDLGLLVHAEHQRLLRRVQIQAEMSRTLSTNCGSFDSLNVST